MGGPYDHTSRPVDLSRPGCWRFLQLDTFNLSVATLLVVGAALAACGGNSGSEGTPTAPGPSNSLRVSFVSPQQQSGPLTGATQVTLASNASLSAVFRVFVDNEELLPEDRYPVGQPNDFPWTPIRFPNGPHTMRATVSDGDRSAEATQNIAVNLATAMGPVENSSRGMGSFASGMDPGQTYGAILAQSPVRGVTKLQVAPYWSEGGVKRWCATLYEYNPAGPAGSPDRIGALLHAAPPAQGPSPLTIEFANYDATKVRLVLVQYCSPAGSGRVSGGLEVYVAP